MQVSFLLTLFVTFAAHAPTIVGQSADADANLHQFYTTEVTPYPGEDLTLLDTWEGGSVLWSDLPWHTTNAGLSKTTGRMLSLAQHYAESTSIWYQNETIHLALNQSYNEIVEAIRNWTFVAKTYPWGNNWYDFTVTAPMDMIYGIYHLYDANVDDSWLQSLKDLVIEYVEKIIESPVVGLGWTRYDSNVIFQGEPFSVAHLWSGDLSDYLNTTAWSKLEAALNIPFVESGQGLRSDYGWIFHYVVRAYGYISATLLPSQAFTMMGFNNTYNDTYYNISAIVNHPEIAANMPGLFRRNGYVRKELLGGNLKTYYQRSISNLNYKTDDIFIQFFGQRYGYAPYESDKNNNGLLPLWLTLRDIWIRNNPVRQYKTNAMYSPGWHYKNELDTNWTFPGINSTVYYAHQYHLSIGLSGVVSWPQQTKHFVNFYSVLKGYSDAADNGSRNLDTDFPVENTYLDGTSVHEQQWISPNGRISYYKYIPSALGNSNSTTANETIKHVAEVGDIVSSSDSSWLFEDGRRIDLIYGNLVEIINQVSFSYTNPNMTLNKSVLIFEPELYSDLYDTDIQLQRLLYSVSMNSSTPEIDITSISKASDGKLYEVQNIGDSLQITNIESNSFGFIITVMNQTGQYINATYMDLANQTSVWKGFNITKVEGLLPQGWQVAIIDERDIIFYNTTYIEYYCGNHDYELNLILDKGNSSNTFGNATNLDTNTTFPSFPLNYFQTVYTEPLFNTQIGVNISSYDGLNLYNYLNGTVENLRPLETFVPTQDWLDRGWEPYNI